jgi:hypothetical protein
MKVTSLLEGTTIKPKRQVNEANVSAKILKDPKQTKMLAIAFRHDHTIPRHLIAKLGPRPTDQEIVQTWSELMDNTLRSNNYGDLSADGKFDDWLTRLYINGQADYEDINGEGGDALGIWKALSKRGLLKPQDQDFNRFSTIKQLQRLRNDPQYRSELARIKDAEKIEKMKREKSDTVIVDNERYYAIVPFNYGACYTFGNAAGYKPNFCTSSSSGADWFQRYAPNGMIVSITDKQNQDSADGKWQFHAATNQLVNGDQERRHDIRWNDEKFSKLFPGLMKEIIQGIETHAEDLKQKSAKLTRGGYDIASEVDAIKTKYPLSYASEVPTADGDEEEGNEEDNTPGTWSVLHIPSNRTARVPAESLENLRDKLTRKYPQYPLTDYRFTKEA